MAGHEYTLKQPSLQTAADELEEKTRNYWKLSNIWNGRVDQRITVGKALDITRELIININPSRPLYGVVLNTEGEIIRKDNRRKKSTKQVSASLYYFPSKAKINVGEVN